MENKAINLNRPINQQPVAKIKNSDAKSSSFKVFSNQQVAKANSVSKKEIRQAIDNLYKNYENEENLKIDKKTSSDYVHRLNQERKKNQLEMKALKEKIREDRKLQEEERLKRFEKFKKDQLNMKNAFKNTVHMINHAQSCLKLRNYVEAKSFLEMAMEEDSDHSYAAYYKEAIRMIQSGQNKYNNFGAIIGNFNKCKSIIEKYHITSISRQIMLAMQLLDSNK